MGAGMNGWELAGLVRSSWPELPIVLATGWGAAIDPLDARAKGIDAVLAKPYLPEDLRRVVAACTQSPRANAA
jgi:CheY-like chemotaxis protein